MAPTPKSILTVIGTNEGNEHLADAIKITKSLGAHLTVIVMDMTRSSAVSQYGAANAILQGEAYEHGSKAVEKHAQDARSQLREVGDTGNTGDGGAVIAAHVLPSEVDDVVADYARLADLTILPLNLPVTSAMFRHVLHGALFRVGSQVLLLPDSGCDFPSSRHAMLAWDSGIQSARALRQSVDVLGQADRVTAIRVDNKPGQGELDEHLVQYMNSHNIEFAFQVQWRGNESTGETLLKLAKASQCDLLVMGAYGHSRLREFIVGSTTRHVIEHASIPVLMMH